MIRLSHKPVSHASCLDESLIPSTDIPLQTTLKFEQCDVALATSYLQAISLAEGRPVERNVAHAIYTNEAAYFPMEADIPDQPMLPVPSQGTLVLPDLKRAINHLEISLKTLCNTVGTQEESLAGFGNWSEQPAVVPDPVVEISCPRHHKHSPDGDLETILQLSNFLESISFGDAHVSRRTEVSLVVSLMLLCKG